jgi:hypothetical protein
MKWLLIVFIVRMDGTGTVGIPIGREFDTRSECAAEAGRLTELQHREKAVGIAFEDAVTYACVRGK